MNTQNWLRQHLGLKLFRHLRRLFKSLHERGVIRTTHFELDFFGNRYRGDWSNNIDNHVYFYGAYEKHILFFMRDYFQRVGEPGVFVDVGANVGHHTLFMSQFAELVCAFEPYPLVRDKMEEKIRMNLLENVRIFPFGLGQRDESLPFYAPRETHLGTGTFVGKACQGAETAMEFPVRNGDKVIEEGAIGGIRLIKIDVEGFEREVLRGLSNTLRIQRPLIVFEVSREVNEAFSDITELELCFPEEYGFLMFEARRRVSGRKSRRFRGRQRLTGEYRLTPLDFGVPDEQINVVACPAERQKLLAD